MPAPQTVASRPSFFNQIASLPANFWYANLMEVFERLAFFGVRAIAPLYLVAASTENGLGLSFVQKGQIYTVWALLQCLIPMVSGGYTDRYGYRKSLAVAFVINAIGYLLMAQSRPLAEHLAEAGYSGAGYWVFMAAACCVATGTAIFKPPVQGTVARATTDATSSMGWGLFYWVVNIGGLIAPMGAALLRRQIDWENVFYAAAIVTLLNFLPAFLLYREPERIAGTGSARSPVAVFLESLGRIFLDLRLLVFLLIFSCFWLMFMQLWDLLPNFIDEWVDTSDVAGVFGWLRADFVTDTGQTKPEMVINIDSAAIILLVVPLSALISRMNKVAAMIIGMVISLVGFVGAGATSIGWICCLMIFIFAIGEMICSPTFSAYIGLIAPPDKKALYMGYSNIPFAIGWALGNLISGHLYENYSSRANLARDYLNTVIQAPADLTNRLALPDQMVLPTLTYLVETDDLEALRSATRTILDWRAADPARARSDLTPPRDVLEPAFRPITELATPARMRAVTRLLWDRYQPQRVWYYLGAMGLVGTLGMILFYLITVRGRGPAAAAG